MLFKNLLEIMGCGAVLHIGTENGESWLFSDTVEKLIKTVPDNWKDRPVVQMYPHEGREGSRYCSELLPGLAIILEGSENGSI